MPPALFLPFFDAPRKGRPAPSRSVPALEEADALLMPAALSFRREITVTHANTHERIMYV